MKCILFVVIIASLTACSNSEDSAPSNNKSENNESDTTENVVPTIDTTQDYSTRDLGTYKGMIGDDIQIYMSLTATPDDKVEGKYFYSSVGKLLTISGTLFSNNIMLKEKVDGKVTGTFKGEMVEDMIDGTWSGNGKKYPFYLQQIGSYEFEEAYERANLPEAISYPKLLDQFKTIQLPYTITDSPEENQLGVNTVKTYFHDYEDEQEFMFNIFYPAIKFELIDHTALILFRSYTPGAFGIYNVFVEMYIMDQDGYTVESAEIGCYCNDTNMGANDYYSTSEEILIEDGKITVYSTHTYATLFPEESDDPFEEINYDTTVYTFDDYSIVKMEE